MTHQQSHQKSQHQRPSAKRPAESVQKPMMPGQSTEEPEPNHPRSSKSKAVMIDQRYEIKKKIDEGTYAKVYLSQDWHQGGQYVVLKILRPRSYEKPVDKV